MTLYQNGLTVASDYRFPQQWNRDLSNRSVCHGSPATVIQARIVDQVRQKLDLMYPDCPAQARGIQHLHLDAGAIGGDSVARDGGKLEGDGFRPRL